MNSTITSGHLSTVLRHYPLTRPQTGIWYMEKLFPGVGIGNVCATLRMLTDVDYTLLERALNLFLEKNDGARIRIIEIDGTPRQYISEYKYRSIPFFDFSDDINELYKWDEEQTAKPFDVVGSDLCYIAMIKGGARDGGFYIKMHHLAADAWSMISCGNQVISYYTSLKKGLPIPEENKPSFLEAVENEAKYLQSARFLRGRQFWNEKFADWRDLTVLKNRKTGATSTRAKRKTLLLPFKLSNKIREYCAQNGVSEFSLFIAAVCMYINRVTGREDITIGTTLLNRTNAREKETIGMFANIAVPLRLHITADMNFESFIRDISGEILRVLRHQKYPYDMLLADVRERLGTADSLFDIVVSYQNSKLIKSEDLDGVVSRWHFNGHQIESLIINLNDRDSDGRLIVDYDFLTDIFYATEIEFIHQHIISLLWHALDNPVKPIARLELISEAEKQKLLYKFNETTADFPSDIAVHRIFEEQAAKTPDEPALYCGDELLTYGQLNARANRLAHTLRARGVSADDVVGLMLYRSVDMVVGILGVLKAGGAYLPIDPEGPPGRAAYMLKDCGAKVLLLHEKTRGFAGSDIEAIDLDDENSYSEDDRNPVHIAGPDNLAYIIYTSGSTGNPKGVMIEHRGLVNRIHWMQKKYPLDQNSVILQKTPYTFDVSVWEFTWWFFAGAKVCMLQPGGEKDPRAIIDAVSRYGVTTMHFVPSMLSGFLEYIESGGDLSSLRSLKQVFASGEALSLAHVNRFNRLLNATNGTELYNLYGPTEASIDVTYFNCSPSVQLKNVPIGKPIDNIHIYILDRNRTLLPIGIPGELYIGGVGVARGYINNPELTAERFVPNPYVPGEIIYRTGDLARWYSQGDIEYLGRLDHQLKIRGLRIELGEIENRLLKHNLIREAVVTGIDENGQKALCAYYVADEDIPTHTLKRFVGAELPEYMVPTYFVRVGSFPLSPNGKIDRKALPLPQASAGDDVEYVPPRNDLDAKLAEICKRVLNKNPVGIDDNLFDLGADSLSVIRMCSAVLSFNRDINVADFYECPTIRELSDKLSGALRSEEREYPIENPDWVFDNITYPLKTRLPKSVFLTGGTGFLGMHIISELLNLPDTNIYCIARGASQQDAQSRFLSLLNFYFGKKYDGYIGNRIRIIKGDVTEKGLGISEEDRRELAGSIDTVIHAAAITRFLGGYKSIARVNVQGTAEAIAFALENKCLLMHISTVSVTGDYLVRNTGGGDFTENDFYVGQNYFDNPYVRSKFEAENLVYRAVREQGLEAAVCRMGNLTGRSADGLFQPNIDDSGFYGAMRSVLNAGAVSKGLLAEEIEFSPVDLAARAVVLIASTPQSRRHIFHVFNPNSLKVSELMEMLKTVTGPVSVKATLVSQEQVSQQDLLAGAELYLDESGELAYKPAYRPSAELTASFLRALGFIWPNTDEKYLRIIIGYLKDIGYLKG